MILDIEGILKGQRLRKCSGEARWHYGYYLLLANNYARLELDFESLADHFISFRGSNPTKEDIERDFREYQENHLVFVYRAGNRMWAQFDTKRSNTKNYRTASDRKSSHPPEAEYRSWLKEQHPEDWGSYHWNPSPELDVQEVPPNQEVIKSSEKLVEVSNISEKLSAGVGVGVGSGKGKKAKSKPSPQTPAEVLPVDTWHQRIKAMVQSAWSEQNKNAECPWGAEDGAQLKLMRSKSPGWLDGQYAQCLANMYSSAGFPRSKLPFEFLPRLCSYLSGPRNEFNREKVNGSNTKLDRTLKNFAELDAEERSKGVSAGDG